MEILRNISWISYCYPIEWMAESELDDKARLFLSDKQFDEYQGLFIEDKRNYLYNNYINNGNKFTYQPHKI